MKKSMGFNDNSSRDGTKAEVIQTSISRFLSDLQPSNTDIRIKTLGFLLLFLLTFPITLIITIITSILHLVTRKPPIINPNAKRILLSGGGMTKALHLARLLSLAGHHIVLTEEYSFTAHRFSRAVAHFCLSADSKIHAPYIQSIIDIVRREKIDIFVPVTHSWSECADSVIKKALLEFNCETFHGDLEQLQMLSDKYEFVTRARSFGLTVPKTYKITDPKQVLEFDFSKEPRQFILKSILDNNITRWDLIKLPCQTRQQTEEYLNALTISEEFPWVMQEFIPGKEYCTHGAMRNGELKLHTCCESSSWLLNYKHLDNKPLILEWIRDFSFKANLTGQASFDFIESYEDGRPYAIECNPRTHTAVATFYNHPRVAEAYLNLKQLADGPIQPYPSACETYWLYHQLWNIFTVKSIGDLFCQLQKLFNGKEAICSIDDPLPFFLQYTVHMPCVLINNLLNPVPFKKVDCNLGLIL